MKEDTVASEAVFANKQGWYSSTQLSYSRTDGNAFTADKTCSQTKMIHI